MEDLLEFTEGIRLFVTVAEGGALVFSPALRNALFIDHTCIYTVHLFKDVVGKESVLHKNKFSNENQEILSIP